MSFYFKSLGLALLLGCFGNLSAQLDMPRASQKALVGQRVGITDITITYSRPAVNDREIWGKLVPYGMNDLGFGTAESSPWRAGADENTIIEFSHDVTVEGEPLKAGTYGLHMVINEDHSATVIFSNNSTSWGSYFYDPAEDALRVEVPMEDVNHSELLTYHFPEVNANSALAVLDWGEKRVPFRIGVDVPAIVLADIRRKLQDAPGFNNQTWQQAANYAMRNSDNMEEALNWADQAVSGQFVGQKNFNNLALKAMILRKMGREDEAAQIMEEALPLGTVFELHQYGRQLIAMGAADRAMEIFKYNAKKHKNTWPVDYGMARAYSARGDYEKALKHLRIAKDRAPDELNKNALATNMEKLQQGQDIN